jgi:hypothetical protein
VKIDANVVRYGRYVIFQMAEVEGPKELFQPFGFCVPPPKCYRSRRPWSFGECRLISNAENVGLRIRMRER